MTTPKLTSFAPPELGRPGNGPAPAEAGRAAAPAVMRSLVIAPQWIGDAVMCEPLLARSRRAARW